MASTVYQFPFSDFPNHKADAQRLEFEIIHSDDYGYGKFTTVLERVLVDEETRIAGVWFQSPLSSEEEITLNTVVAAHTGDPLNPIQTVVIDGSQQNKAAPVAVIGRQGDELIFVSHNFCDKTTWYGDSQRVDNEVLTDSGDGLTWTSIHPNWIDIISGRIQKDDEISASIDHGYLVHIYVDSMELAMRAPFAETGGDYEVDWDDGKVIFYVSQAGKVVTASYSYAVGSTWYLRPPTGKNVVIEKAEADFSNTGVVMNDTIVYGVWGPVDVFAPDLMPDIPSGTLIELAKYKYKRLSQITREAIGSYPAVPENGYHSDHYNLPVKEFRKKSRGIQKAMQPVAFCYSTTRELDAQYGLELRVFLENDQVFGGENVSMTFYSIIKDSGT